MDARPHLQVMPTPPEAARSQLRVVAGIDGSPLTERVLRWCAGLAAVADVEVVAVYALEARSYPPQFRHGLPRAANRSHESWRDEIRARIDAEWCAPLHLAGLRRRVIVGDGHPWEVLGRAARRHDAGLVVVGCRPRRALVEALRPAVSRRLLREAPCPVVVVPADGGDAAEIPPPTRMLVASDGGAAAARALSWAAGLAAGIDAEVVAARVIAAGAPAPPGTDSAGRPRIVEDVNGALQAELDSLGDRLPARHRTAVLVGEPPAMLLALAEAEAAGLVVLGVDESRRPAWLRAGSVVALLTRSASCPVVLVTTGAAPTSIDPSRRTRNMGSENMDTETQRPRGVRFASGTVVSPGEYRNCDTGSVRYFDGNTRLPGGVNSASWQQISDHHHPSESAVHPEQRHNMPDTASRPVRFPAGSMVSPGEYRNVETGVVRYFDGTTPLPGGTNASSWQQVSDHHHPEPQQRS